MPPFVVLRMALLLPAAYPLFALRKYTEFRFCVVPLVCAVHVAPPSVVLRITPPAPTAKPTSVVIKKTAFISVVSPLVCAVHVAPPSVVLRITPPAPTAVTSPTPCTVLLAKASPISTSVNALVELLVSFIIYGTPRLFFLEQSAIVLNRGFQKNVPCYFSLKMLYKIMAIITAPMPQNRALASFFGVIGVPPARTGSVVRSGDPEPPP